MQATLELLCPSKIEDDGPIPAMGNVLMACATLNHAATSSCTAAAMLACARSVLPWVLSPFGKVQGQMSQQQLLGLASQLHQPAFVFMAACCARRCESHRQCSESCRLYRLAIGTKPAMCMPYEEQPQSLKCRLKPMGERISQILLGPHNHAMDEAWINCLAPPGQIVANAPRRKCHPHALHGDCHQWKLSTWLLYPLSSHSQTGSYNPCAQVEWGI